MQAVMGVEYFTLDVFTTRRFSGNPLGVVTEADHLSDEQMAAIAREFNLSETIFIRKPKRFENHASVRIFTPAHELPFAGHPTIGCAILLAEMGADMSRAIDTTIRLEEKIGLVEVDVTQREGEPLYAEMTAPQIPVAGGDVPGVGAIARALGLVEEDIGFGLHQPAIYDGGNSCLFVPLASRQALAKVRPVGSEWAGLGEAGKFGVYSYCRGPAQGNEYHGRFMAPELGVAEDPATGSAVVAFAGALNKALVLEDGNHDWLIHQGEDMGRPSRIDLKVAVKDGELELVKIGGHAVRVARGVLSL